MKFKVGDKVKVTATKKRLEKICIIFEDLRGIIGKIIKIVNNDVLSIVIDVGPEYGGSWYVAEQDLELVESAPESKTIRTFSTGATRDTDLNKLDYEGFLSSLVLERYAEYLNKHRVQSDGQLRDSDNWQKGIPKDIYIKSAWRHFMAFWKVHRGYKDESWIEDSICAVLFNCMGYLHEHLKEKNEV